MLFNAEQQAALDAEGTVLLVAGAGAGKTRVLTHKIVKIIREQGVHPGRVLSFTFTNKAAKEMAERLAESDMLGAAPEGVKYGPDYPWLGTMHSVLLNLLRADLPYVDPRYAPRIKPIDQYRSKRIMEEILSGWDYKQDDPRWNPLGYLAKISAIISQGIDYDEAPKFIFNEESTDEDEFLYKIWGEYIKRKLIGDGKNSKYVDFDDMIYLTVKMFREHPAVERKWQSRFSYILVDEYQDTDVLQMEAVKRLSAGHQNLFVVGDVRQSIYAFRGAQVRLTTEFKEHFPHGQVLYMNINYRSTTSVVDTGNQLIRHGDFGKFPVPDVIANKAEAGGVEYLGHLEDDELEAKMVATTIASEIHAGRSPGDFAILYRVNAQSETFETSLMAEGIPYVIQGSTGFYAREEIKDMVAYMTMVHYIIEGYKDHKIRDAINQLMMVGVRNDRTVSRYKMWERVINRPNRFLGNAFLAAWGAYVATGVAPDEALQRGYQKSYMQNSARELHRVLMGVVRRYEEHKNPGRLVSDLRSTLSYDTWVSRNLGDSVENSKVDNLNVLQGRASDFPDLASFLLFAAANAKPEDDNGEGGSSVKLMTVHRSKGLEFPVVFVVGMTQGILPHWRAALTSEGLEEERRIAYVAVTRAKQTAFLSGCARRMRTSATLAPSQFLGEMGVDDSEELDEEGSTSG